MVTFSAQIEMDSDKRASFSINRENGLAVFLAVILFVVFAPVIATSPGPNSSGGSKDVRLEEGKVGLAFSDGSARRLSLAESK